MLKGSKIGVVGLGTIGVQELALWRRAGKASVGYDISPDRIKQLNDTGTSARLADLDDCDILILCLPNLDADGLISTEAFETFLTDFGRLPQRDRLVVVASTVPIGYTRYLGERLGPRTLVAHAPERFNPGATTRLGEIPRVIGALSQSARDLTDAMYREAGVETHVVDSVEVAEASKLLENSFRLVNIAFINEFAELCRRLGIPAADVIDAAGTKPFGFMAHYPGVGAGGPCIPIVPRFLVEAAEAHNLAMPILEAALIGNESISERVASQLNDLLAAGNGTRKRVLVVGATYKPDYPDVRGSAALRFATSLAAHHDIVLFDPIADLKVVPKSLALRRTLPEGERFDAVVIALKHRDTDMDALRRLSPILMDLVRGHVEVGESVRS
ncbi:MAG TPA: nucleotide sugar dehydrogenase [Candidatus Dormibacteraeota bacterium]|nr:nucleotide sugar dehydrogenase [Candidatus Dormibacteraeota bacterium]